MRVCAALCLTAVCLITVVTSQVDGAPNNATKPTKPTKPPKTTVTRTTRVPTTKPTRPTRTTVERTTRVPTTKMPKPVPTRTVIVTSAAPPPLTTLDDGYVTSGTTKVWRISRTNRTEVTKAAVKPTRPGIITTVSSVARVTTADMTSIASTRPLPVITTSGSADGIHWTEKYPMISTENPPHHNRHHNQHHHIHESTISPEVTTAKSGSQTAVLSTPKDQRTMVKSTEVDGSHHKDSHQKDHGKSHHPTATTSRSSPGKTAASVKSAAGSSTSGIGSSSDVLRRLQTLTGAAAALALSVFVMQRY